MRYVICLLLPVLSAFAAPLERVPILLDTDIGSEIDDSFALALILGSHELDLRGVTTVSGNTQQRAMMLCRFLTMTGRRNTQVAVGAEPQPTCEIKGMYQYYYHPDVLFNRTTKPVQEKAIEFLANRLKEQQGKITLLATGPLTNVARLLKEKPESKTWIKRIVIDGSSLAVDVKAAQAVFASGVPLVVVPGEVTKALRLDEASLKRAFSPGTALTNQVRAMHQLCEEEPALLAAPFAAALCFDERFAKLNEVVLQVTDEGELRKLKGEPNARIVESIRAEDFLKWYVARMESLVAPERKPAKVLERGGMPARVHVAEDYDNDIERRWWMSGVAETKNVLPGSKRACRGVLTHDFDDLLGNPKAMHTAVIFNPVPGPPMGPNTRLSFRYWIKGTGTMRVQIYSLSNGYHRHLILKDLPQGKWEAATVDMTVARRPDGTGGPLAENERIDDIQFYTDPEAELIIDDVFLYDAALPTEKRPFPKQVFYSGWFDSGKQGKEWPGTFEIVEHKPPLTGKAAKSVVNPETKSAWIRLHLRGIRMMGDTTHLSFRYHLSRADSMRVVLLNRTTEDTHSLELKAKKREEWNTDLLDFTRTKGNKNGKELGKGDGVDEIHFLIPEGAELMLDDILFYERG